METEGQVIGKRVRGLRVGRRWSQKELAVAARVGRSWLSLVEAGRIENPGGWRMDRIARALGVSPRYLLTGEPGGDTDDDPLKRSLLSLVRQFSAAQIEQLIHIGHIVFPGQVSAAEGDEQGEGEREQGEPGQHDAPPRAL